MLRIFAYLSIAWLLPLVAMAQAAPPLEPAEVAPVYPRPSLEAPRPHLGDRGQVLITTDADLHFASSWWSDDHSGQTSWWIRPALEVFVLKNFSVGGALTLGHTTMKSQTTLSIASVNGQSANVPLMSKTSSSTLQLVPHAGYNLALADWVSLYARLGVVLGFELADLGGSEHNSARYLGLSLSAPLMFHVAPHFEIGFGPNFYVDLLRSHSQTPNVVAPGGKVASIGMDMLVGGWF